MRIVIKPLQLVKKTGTIKERKYNVDTPCALPIKAKNKEEAIEKFINDAPITGDGSGEDSNIAKTKAIFTITLCEFSVSCEFIFMHFKFYFSLKFTIKLNLSNIDELGT